MVNAAFAVFVVLLFCCFVVFVDFVAFVAFMTFVVKQNEGLPPGSPSFCWFLFVFAGFSWFLLVVFILRSG